MNGHDRRSPIGVWIGAFRQRLHSQTIGDDPIIQTVDRVVQIADPVICQAKHYRQVLADPISDSMGYFQSLLGAIPGPIVLDSNRYYDDPTVKALFASPDELDEVLRHTPENNKLRQQREAGEVVAMMTMRRQERTVFGYKQEGELIVRDVRQQAVSFTDHRIVAPSTDLATTRAGIVNRGLEALAMVAMERIATLRANKAELQGKKEYLKGMVKIFGVRSRRQEIFAPFAPHKQEDLCKVEQLLAEVELELETLRQQIGLPEQSLAQLEKVMRSPETILTVHPQKLRLNWMGVRVEDEPGEEGNDITFAELSLKDDKHSAVLVTFTLPTKIDSRL